MILSKGFREIPDEPEEIQKKLNNPKRNPSENPKRNPKKTLIIETLPNLNGALMELK